MIKLGGVKQVSGGGGKTESGLKGNIQKRERKWGDEGGKRKVLITGETEINPPN